MSPVLPLTLNVGIQYVSLHLMWEHLKGIAFFRKSNLTDDTRGINPVELREFLVSEAHFDWRPLLNTVPPFPGSYVCVYSKRIVAKCMFLTVLQL